jgi:hypothetical protein
MILTLCDCPISGVYSVVGVGGVEGKEYLHRDACVFGVVAKDADLVGLGEFLALVVEVFCDADVLHLGPGILGADLGGGEDYGVEGHVILAHKLNQVHLLRVLPPLLQPPFLDEYKVSSRCRCLHTFNQRPPLSYSAESYNHGMIDECRRPHLSATPPPPTHTKFTRHFRVLPPLLRPLGLDLQEVQSHITYNLHPARSSGYISYRSSDSGGLWKWVAAAVASGMSVLQNGVE